MDSALSNNTIRFIVYYIVVAAATFLLMQPFYEPPMMVRLFMLALIFVPTFWAPRILPAIFLVFFGADSSSFTHILPANDIYIFFVVLVSYLMYPNKSRFFLNALFVLGYFFICSVIHLEVGSTFFWFFIAILLADMIKDKEELQLLFCAYLALSLFLGLLFLTHWQTFLIQYSLAEDGLERSSWINPNVFGGAIAAGGVLAMSYLTGILDFVKTRFMTWLSIATAIIVALVLIMNASRGAFIAFSLCSLLMFIRTDSKLYVKILVSVIIVGFIYFMYTHNLFDLLLARIENENTSTVGGRTEIWMKKIPAFVDSSDYLQLLFGIGQTACVNIAIYFSTHNDFVTSFIAYGLIGFLIFVYTFFVYPVIKSDSEKRIRVLLLLIYLFAECMVLEPLFRGYFVEIFFYFFILKFIMIEASEEDLELEESEELYE